MEYTDAWFMQQGVRPIDGSTHVRLYYIHADSNYFNIYSHIYV